MFYITLCNFVAKGIFVKQCLCSAGKNQTLVWLLHFNRHLLCYFCDENVGDDVELSSPYVTDQPARPDLLRGKDSYLGI
jgi:hypothetical protein